MVESCCGLIPKSPYAACYRTPRCNQFTPNWKSDPWRTEFCNRFGHLQPQMCPEAEDPCMDVNEPLRSLDYFSSPPMFRHGSCATQFRCGKKYICEPSGCGDVARCPTRCPGIPQLPACYKPKPNPNADTICGLCTKTEDMKTPFCPASSSCDNNADSSCDLGFTVYMADTRTKEEMEGPPLPKSQVEYCLHPSRFRHLDTVYKTEYLDFFQLKSKCELSLYRSPPAINNSRPKLRIPMYPETEKRIYDMTQPIYVNARAIKCKSYGQNGPTTFSVCVPGPITIG